MPVSRLHKLEKNSYSFIFRSRLQEQELLFTPVKHLMYFIAIDYQLWLSVLTRGFSTFFLYLILFTDV